MTFDLLCIVLLHCCLFLIVFSFFFPPLLTFHPHVVFLPFSWPLPQLEPSHIRLIVYQDCERRGRNVLFDSNARKKGTEETPVNVSYKFSVCSPFLNTIYY